MNYKKTEVIGEIDVTPDLLTGKTAHTIDGAPVRNVRKLRIIKLEGDASYYLIHFDANDCEITDTCHDSIFEAVGQASYEYNVSYRDWNFML